MMFTFNNIKIFITTLILIISFAPVFKCNRPAYSIFCDDYRNNGRDDNFVSFIRSDFAVNSFRYTPEQLLDICESINSESYASTQWSIGCKRFRKYTITDLLVSYVKKRYHLSRFNYDNDYLNAICDEAHTQSNLWSIACESFRRTSQSRLVIAYANNIASEHKLPYSDSFTYNDLNAICDADNNPDRIARSTTVQSITVNTSGNRKPNRNNDASNVPSVVPSVRGLSVLVLICATIIITHFIG